MASYERQLVAQQSEMTAYKSELGRVSSMLEAFMASTGMTQVCLVLDIESPGRVRARSSVANRPGNVVYCLHSYNNNMYVYIFIIYRFDNPTFYASSTQVCIYSFKLICVGYMPVGIEGEDAGYEVDEPMHQSSHISRGSSQHMYFLSSLCASICLCNLN